jgi:hypothetical protein
VTSRIDRDPASSASFEGKATAAACDGSPSLMQRDGTHSWPCHLRLSCRLRQCYSRHTSPN